MNHLKSVVASAALVLAFAIPSANAQPAEQRGVVDCGIQFVSCMTSGGNIVTCALAFGKCLIFGGKAAALDRRD